MRNCQIPADSEGALSQAAGYASQLGLRRLKKKSPGTRPGLKTSRIGKLGYLHEAGTYRVLIVPATTPVKS
jgi:hypothetical protein